MTTGTGIIVRDRRPSEVFGYTTVTAQVDNGESGDYLIKNHLAGTQAEIEEILAQSAHRTEAREATKAGVD